MQGQHWNDILSYVKINLGVPLNFLEISDEDLTRYLREHVLTFISNFSPHQKYSYITDADYIPNYGSDVGGGSPMYAYQIPLPDGEYIVDIYDAYPTKSTLIADTYGATLTQCGDAAIDAVLANTYIDAVQSLGVRNTWEFIPPNMMIFEQEVTACVIIYNTLHEQLNTMRPDIYHTMFKPLCLANVKLWIASLRSKYENLTTPFGAINLDWQRLQQEGEQLKQEVQMKLDLLPPDHLIWVGI